MGKRRVSSKWLVASDGQWVMEEKSLKLKAVGKKREEGVGISP